MVGWRWGRRVGWREADEAEGEREGGDNVKEGGDLASRHLQYLTGCDELSPFS